MVAPTRMTVPSSTTGRKRSCWLRLKRWISSTNSSVPCPVLRRRARRLKGFLEIGDAGKDRRQLLEMQLERGRQQPRDGGLAGAGRAPQDHRMRPARRDHPADRAFRSQQMILAHNLAQAFGRRRSARGRGASSARPPFSKRSLMEDSCPHLSLSRKRSETSSAANGFAMRGKKAGTKTHCPIQNLAKGS